MLFKVLPQLGQVAVLVIQAGGTTHDGTILEAGVIVLIRENQIAFANDRANRPQVGQIARTEDDRILSLFPLGDRLFQLPMQISMPTQQPGTRRPSAICFRRRDRRLNQPLISRQTQIIITSKINHRATIQLNHGTRTTHDGFEGAMPAGLVDSVERSLNPVVRVFHGSEF